MSSTYEQESGNQARDEEKAALARAKAELEAEREAMRAELAAIEEEERLEAERLLHAAETGKSTKPGSFGRFLDLYLSKSRLIPLHSIHHTFLILFLFN